MLFYLCILCISIGTLKQNIVYDPKWTYSFATSVSVDIQYSLKKQDIYIIESILDTLNYERTFTIIFLLESRKLKLINIGEGIIQKCNYKNRFIWRNMFVNIVTTFIFSVQINIFIIFIDNTCRKAKQNKSLNLIKSVLYLHKFIIIN